MKRIIYLLVFCSFLTSQAQEKKIPELVLTPATQEKASKVVEESFEVKGVCGMCKERIEAAALRTKGVKLANWDKNSGILQVTFSQKKTSLEEIQANIAKKGHATAHVKADPEAYKKLPECCQYSEDGIDKH